MRWTEEAQKEIEKAPIFVRGMAKRAVEKEVKQDGRNEVLLEDVKKGRDKHIGYVEEKDDNVKKIAIVRCETVSEVCPGIACFKAFNKRKNHFAEYQDNVEIIGFFTCGGCSGRRVSRLIDKLLPYGLDAVHLSSCMLLDDEYPKCPYVKQIQRTIEQKGIKVIGGTHH